MKLPVSSIKKIAIFRALQLGDMLCSIPAISSLKNSYPESEITLIGLPWAITFVERFNQYFSDFISFPGYPGLPEQKHNPVEVVNFIKKIQESKFDLILQMQGNGSYVNPLNELFNPKFLAGYYHKTDYCPNEELFMEYPSFGHEIERHLSLINFLGISTNAQELEFPLSETDYTDYQKLDLGLPDKNFVCIHPGSRGTWRQWPTEHFALLADICYQHGYKIFLTGTEVEKPLTETVGKLMKSPHINLAGKTNLGSLGVLISNANLLISNCTGVSHIAAALKTPSIVISMDGEPDRWAPLDTLIHKTTNWLKDNDLQRVIDNTLMLLHSMKSNPKKVAKKIFQ